MNELEALRARVRELEEQERNAGKAEYEALRKAATFEWRLEKQPFGFHVSCRYDEKSREAIASWRAAFPQASVINFRKPEEWHGMAYILGYTKEGQAFLQGGGGSVILARDRSSFGPILISAEDAAQFEAGIIPEHLKKPW